MNLPAALQDAADRVDATFVGATVRAMGISTSRVRAWLRFRGFEFAEPGVPEPPPIGALDRTARRVVDRSSNLGAAVGFGGALVGGASVPPEAALGAVLTLRMVQRLAVVYGFELETERGREAVTKALAAVWDVALPAGGVVDVHLRDLPRLLTGRSRPTELGAGLVRAIGRRALGLASPRVSRWIPVWSAPSHARDAKAVIREGGERAIAVLRRLADAPDGGGAALEEAIVVR